MLSCKQPLNYLNLAVFVGTMMPSRYNLSVTQCHTVVTRKLYGGFATWCCLPKTIWQLRLTIVLPSCRDNARYHRYDTKKRRNSYEMTGFPHFELTVDTRRKRWTHEVNTNINLNMNFLTCQRFCQHSRSYC